MASLGLVKKTNGRLGVTEPISLSGPTEFDVTKTQELEKVKFLYHVFMINIVCISFIGVSDWDSIFVDQFLADAGLYESQEEAVSRDEVLGRLDQVDSIVR